MKLPDCFGRRLAGEQAFHLCAKIAQLEGVAVNTVYTRLYHARREFMTLLARAEGQEPPK